MKKLLPLLLALLLPATTLAEESLYTPALQAEKLAVRAMYEKYSFTLETIGTFFTTIPVETDGAWHIVFHSDVLPPSRAGQYEAIVTGDDVQLTWTHDGTDVDYTTGDPACPVWGPEQIAVYLGVHYTTRHKWIAPYFAEGEECPESATSVWLELGLEHMPEDEVPRLPDNLRAAANAAVKDFYGMTDEQFALFERAERDMAVAPDGSKYFSLVYPSMDMCIHLLMAADTGEIVDITLMSGGNG